MLDNAQISAETGQVQINTPNEFRDGSGTLGTLLAAGTNGSMVTTVIVKAQDATREGLVRLFIDDGTNTYLVEEFYIPETHPTSFVQTYQTALAFPNGGLWLANGSTLKVSTVQGEFFNVFSTGYTWIYA